MRWLYAAYRKGAFEAPPEMDPATFSEWVMAELEKVGEAFILTSPMEGEDRPVAVVLARFSDHRMEPHVWWFPWSTDRNKIECAVKFLNTMRTTNLILIAAEEVDWRFYDHLLRYGMMKMVGKIQDYFGEGNDAKFYQTRGLRG